jgi:methionine aminotransferase
MFASKLPNYGNTIFSTMSALAQQHNAINLGQGFADYAMSATLCDMVTQSMAQHHNQYSPMPGVLQLRQVIANKVQQLHKATINPDTEITITPGGTYGIYTALTTILQPGDEVIVLEPAYDSYIANIEMNNAVPILVPLNLPEFSVDWQKVQDAVSPKTKAIIINTPHNPGGYIFTDADWQALISIVQDTNMYIVSDEVYEHIVMDGAEHLSILRYPALWHRTFAVFSFGKVFHNTGWKLGYTIAPTGLMLEYRKLHQFIAFSCNTPMQYAIANYLAEPNHYLQLPSFFQQKRDLFLTAMQNSKFTLHQAAAGSFFQTMSYQNISDLPDTEFAVWLTEQHGVASIPISAFYKKASTHKLIRFCFAKKQETLLAAAQRLCML